MISIRPAKLSDFQNIIQGRDALLACGAYFNASLFSWTGLVDEKIACVWGLVAPSILSESAYLWLLTSDLIEEHKFTFVRHSQLVLPGMLEDFPLISGHVLADQARSKKWLKWLGVTFGPAIDRGQTRLIPFELRRASGG